MTDIFQGDPKIDLTVEGSRLIFVGGQPVMDQGLENQALISLFTSKGWCGNSLFADVDQQIGSDFEKIASQPITRSMLIDLEKAAKKALEYPAFGKVDVIVRNPASTRLEVEITIAPPGKDIKTLLLSRNGLNWQLQATNPAYKRIQ